LITITKSNQYQAKQDSKQSANHSVRAVLLSPLKSTHIRRHGLPHLKSKSNQVNSQLFYHQHQSLSIYLSFCRSRSVASSFHLCLSLHSKEFFAKFLKLFSMTEVRLINVIRIDSHFVCSAAPRPKNSIKMHINVCIIYN